jgi:hypothetical protein
MVYMATTWHNGSIAKHMSRQGSRHGRCSTVSRRLRMAYGLHQGAAAQTRSSTDLVPSANEVSSYFNDGHKERGPIVMEFLFALSQ